MLRRSGPSCASPTRLAVESADLGMVVAPSTEFVPSTVARSPRSSPPPEPSTSSPTPSTRGPARPVPAGQGCRRGRRRMELRPARAAPAPVATDRPPAAISPSLPVSASRRRAAPAVRRAGPPDRPGPVTGGPPRGALLVPPAARATATRPAPARRPPWCAAAGTASSGRTTPGAPPDPRQRASTTCGPPVGDALHGRAAPRG